jgi:hypothetical protein
MIAIRGTLSLPRDLSNGQDGVDARASAGDLHPGRDDGVLLDQLRSELLGFPAGKYDDQVDALGLIGQLLDLIIPGERPRATVPVQRDRYSRRRDDDEAINWKTV